MLPVVTVSGSKAYDDLGALYDVWCADVDYDIGFYLLFCEDARDPVIELGAGTGRVAVELCRHNHTVIAVDGSPNALAAAEQRAQRQGVSQHLTTIVGDLRSLPRELPLTECVISPFRTLMHLHDDEECVLALRQAVDLLDVSGRFAFDVFEPTDVDIEATHGRTIERPNGFRERALWDRTCQTIELSIRQGAVETSMSLRWRTRAQWSKLFDAAGVHCRAAYTGFDLVPLRDRRGDQVYVVERRSS